MNCYIAYEVNNPINMIFYKPLSLDTNILKIRLLDNIQLKLNQEYEFIFNLNGINLALIGKPIQVEGNNATILIRESRIELRRYPRITVPENLVKVQIDKFKGILKDISLGGCRIVLNGPIISRLLNQGYEKIAKFILPDDYQVELPVQIVWISKEKRQISCAFKERNGKVLELYKRIINLIINSVEK